MSSYVEGTLIGAGIVAATTVLGFVLHGRREGRALQEARTAAYRTELQAAMRAYLAALDDLFLEGENKPPKPRLTRADRWFERQMRGTTLEFLSFLLVRLIERLLFGQRRHDLLDRLTAASAHLRLVAPLAVEIARRRSRLAMPT